MFYINLWGFSTNPLIWVITLKNRKHLFCVFLRFRDLLELKQSEAFSGVIIFPRATKWEEEAHEGSHEAQTILDGVGPWPSCVTQVRLTVVPCGDPRLPIRNSRYAYNSRSHDQYVVSPHNRADIKVTSSITVPNKKSYNWSHDQDW
jgi:hypothetical protein